MIYRNRNIGLLIMGGSILLLLASCTFSLGQEQWEKENEGAIKDVEIEIVKERQLTLPRANRNFEKVPPRPFEPISPAIIYEFKNLSFTTPDHSPTVRPLRLKQEELLRLYGNSLSAGLGNYNSYFVAGSIATKRDKNKLLGADFYWRSFGKGPVGEDMSASSGTRIKLFGKHIGTDVTADGDVSYQNDRTYFYGYAPGTEIDRDKIKQVYEKFGAQAGIENTKKADFNYQIRGAFSALKDAYVSSENEGSLLFSGDYMVDKSSSVTFLADFFLISRKDSAFSDSRSLFRLKPAYKFILMDNLELAIGLNMAIRNDAPAGSGTFNLYPNITARYSWADNVTLFASVTGDMDKVNLHTLSAENLWLNSNNTLTHTNRSIDLLGGIEGRLGRKVTAKAGASFATLKNFYFYQNVRDGLDLAGNQLGIAFDKFNVVFDNSTQRFNPFGEMSYTHEDVLGITLRADYFNYTTSSIASVWHRPTYLVNMQLRYNIFDKLLLQAGWIGQGGMKALDPGTNLIVNLDPAMDLNFRARYFFSKQISVFIQFDNLLSNTYPLYLSYPARGFQGLIGASWNF